MGELKGQLIGILLVIIMFGIVASAMTNIFTTTATKISQDFSSIMADLDND